MLDAEELRSRLVDYLRAIGSQPQQKGDKWKALCPLHADTHPSLSVKERGGVPVWYCQPCKEGGDIFKLHQKRTGASGFPAQVAGVAEVLGVSANGARPKKEAAPKKPASPPAKVLAERVHEYHDAGGKLLFEVVVQSLDNGKKRAWQRRPDGRGGRVNGLGDTPRPLPLFRLPELLASEGVVWVPEGERDADNLRADGSIATCGAMGAGAWSLCAQEPLRDRDVIVCPDNDKAGREHAEQVARSLAGVARSVRVVDWAAVWDSMPDKGDVSDALEDGNTLEDIEAVAVDWQPGETTPSGGAVFQWDIKPASELWTDDHNEIERMSAPILVNHLLRQAETLLLVGGSKTWKTWITIGLAVSVDAGKAFLGTFSTTRAKCLYLNYELKDETFRKRLCMIAGSCPVSLDVQSFRGKDKPTLAQLEDLILAQGYEVVFIDPLYKTGWLQHENDNMLLAQDFEKIQRVVVATGASFVVDDHTAKGGGKDKDIQDAARGGSVKGGDVDNILQLVPYDGEEPGLITVKAIARDFAPQENTVVRVKFDDHRLSFEPTDLKADPLAADRAGQKILEVLGEYEPGASVADLVARLKFGENTIRTACNRLAEEDKLIRFPDPKHSQRALHRLPDLVP